MSPAPSSGLCGHQGRSRAVYGNSRSGPPSASSLCSGLQAGMDKWAWIPEIPKGLDQCSETPDVIPCQLGQVPGVRACVLTEPVGSVQGCLQALLRALLCVFSF